MQEILMEIDNATGILKTETKGFKGTSCVKETEKLLEGSHAKQTKRKLKHEYNRTQV